MELTVQIRTGGYTGDPSDLTQVLDAIRDVFARLPVSRVIMGWCVLPEVYQQAASIVHDLGAELYLWLPMFSENGLLRDCSPVIGLSGQESRPYQLDDSENFDFYCPNSPVNQSALLSLYDEYFAGIGFDGVFLDKIRYPSLINGLDGGLGCFCPNCLTAYDEAGIDIDALRSRISALPYLETPFGVSDYQTGRYVFTDSLWDNFFSLRQSIVSVALRNQCAALRQLGLKIGLDVFAPFLSQFVGQDITLLSQLADFIKPMMYSATLAPAGLPFETAALLRATGMEDDPRSYYRIIGFDPTIQPFDLYFCAREIEALRQACICPIHPGIELNRIPGVAPTTTEYVSRCLDAYEGAPGLVLSWNLLNMPANHLDTVAARFR